MTYYFAQNATVEVREPGTARFKVVGAAQEVSIDTEFEVEELYQFGSILRTTAARHHASINVKVSTAQFGSFADDAAWFWKVLNAAGVTNIEDASFTGKQVTISDTTNLPMFSIAGEWVSDDGSETIYGRVDGVYFKNFSWGGALGEYIIEELEGTGSQVTFTNDKKYAAGGQEALWSNVGQRLKTNVEAVIGAGPTLTFNVEAVKEYTSITVKDISGAKFDDVASGSSTHNYKPCFEPVLADPVEGETYGVCTVTHKTPSAGINPPGTAIINVVADGISKQIPVEFTAKVEPSE